MYDNEFASSDLTDAGISRTLGVTARKEMSLCGGKRIYGGYFVLGTGAKSFSATYSGLPTHTSVQVRYLFYMIDSWLGTDTMKLKYNSTTIYSATKSAGADVCGNTSKVADSVLSVDKNSSSNSTGVTIGITWSPTSDTSIASGGLREYSVSIQNATRNATYANSSSTI